MATEFEIINNGNYPNDLSADTVRGAFGKAKNNFGKVQVKAKVVALQIGYAAGVADFAEVINAKPANSLIVGPDEFPLFKGATAVGESPARQVVFFVNGAGKGTYGTGGTVSVNSADIVVVYDSAAGLTVNQNNETKYISFGKINQTDFSMLPTSEVANLFNTSVVPIIISETQIPWVQITVSGPSQPSVKHIYQFLPGKGHYGSGGATVTYNDFKFVNTLGATQQDVENTGNTETINLGEVTNYITALNSVGRDFTDENLQYFVKYTISGTSYFKIFIGTTYGMYGGTNTLQFADEMWQDVVTSTVPGVGFVSLPIPYPTLRLKAKGVNPNTEVVNIEPFLLEIGDICEGFKDSKTYIPEALYNGGDSSDINNYTVLSEITTRY